jgi:hypothetical protein
MKPIDIQKLIHKHGEFVDKFIALSDYKQTDKLAINESKQLYIQPKTPWRYFIRKFRCQNHKSLNEYLYFEFIVEYDAYMNYIFVEIYNYLLNEQYYRLICSNFHLINNILPGLFSIKTYYDTHHNTYELCKTLDLITNKLSDMISKIKKIVQDNIDLNIDLNMSIIN